MKQLASGIFPMRSPMVSSIEIKVFGHMNKDPLWD